MWGTDRRHGCITGRNLSLLVGDLKKAGFPPMDVHTLARRFREKQLYPARDFAHRCAPRRPTLFVSYDWGNDFIDLQEAVHSGLQLVAAIVRQHRPTLDEDCVQRLCLDQIGIWIDHVFIDQSSREITEEVRFVVPNVIEAADIHFVLSPTALTRAWCCYELALFTRTRPPDMQSGVLRSFVAPTTLRYRGWSSAKTTNPGDKPVLQQALEEQYPGGVDGVDALLIQSSLQSDRSVLSSPAYSGEAAQLVIASIDRWLEI